MKKIVKVLILLMMALTLVIGPITTVFAEEPGVTTTTSEVNFTKIESGLKGDTSDLYDDNLLGKASEDELVYFSKLSLEGTKYKDSVINRFTFANHSKDDVFIHIVAKKPFKTMIVGDNNNKFANDSSNEAPILYQPDDYTHLSIYLPKDKYNEKPWSFGILEEKNVDKKYSYDVYVEFGRSYRPEAKTPEELESYLEKNAKKYTIDFSVGESREHTLIKKDKDNTYTAGGEQVKIEKVETKGVNKDFVKYAIAAIAVIGGFAAGVIVRKRKNKFR